MMANNSGTIKAPKIKVLRGHGLYKRKQGALESAVSLLILRNIEFINFAQWFQFRYEIQ